MKTDTLTLNDLFEIAAQTELRDFPQTEVMALRPLYIAVIKRTWDEADAIDTVKFILRLEKPLESQRRVS